MIATGVTHDSSKSEIFLEYSFLSNTGTLTLWALTQVGIKWDAKSDNESVKIESHCAQLGESLRKSIWKTQHLYCIFYLNISRCWHVVWVEVVVVSWYELVVMIVCVHMSLSALRGVQGLQVMTGLMTATLTHTET